MGWVGTQEAGTARLRTARVGRRADDRDGESAAELKLAGVWGKPSGGIASAASSTKAGKQKQTLSGVARTADVRDNVRGSRLGTAVRAQLLSPTVDQCWTSRGLALVCLVSFGVRLLWLAF